MFTMQCVCWVGVKKNNNLETGNLQGENFFFLSQKENPCGVQFVSSFYRRVEEEKRRGFGGTGIRKRQVAVHFTVD